jgi:hypothetical protein
MRHPSCWISCTQLGPLGQLIIGIQLFASIVLQQRDRFISQEFDVFWFQWVTFAVRQSHRSRHFYKSAPSRREPESRTST